MNPALSPTELPCPDFAAPCRRPLKSGGYKVGGGALSSKVFPSACMFFRAMMESVNADPAGGVEFDAARRYDNATPAMPLHPGSVQ